MITAMATMMFLVGVVLLLGPTLLKFFLTSCSAVQPISRATLIFLLVEVVLGVILNVTLRKTSEQALITPPLKRGKVRKKLSTIKNVSVVVNVVSILSLILIVFNSLFVKANNGWCTLMEENDTIFAVLRYIGVVLIAAGGGFFVGRIKRKTNNSRKPQKKVYRPSQENVPDDECDFDGRDENNEPVKVEVLDRIPRVVGTTEATEATGDYFSHYSEVSYPGVSDDEVIIHLPKGAARKLK